MCATLRSPMSVVAAIEEVITRSRESARLLPTALPEAPSAPGPQEPVTLAEAIAKYDAATESASGHAASMKASAEGLRGTSGGQFDPNDEMYRQLTDLEISFVESAKFHWKACKRGDIARRIPLRRALERFALACEAMAASARQLKGAIQAHDANDTEVRRLVPMRSPEEVGAALRKLSEP